MHSVLCRFVCHTTCSRLQSSAMGLNPRPQITKAMDVTIDRSGSFPMLSFKNRESYQKSRTEEYDAQAMRYLSYVLYPLVSIVCLFTFGAFALL